MELGEAWKKLGRDPRDIVESISSRPREKRVERAYELLEEAKTSYRKLVLKHHPDRGGDRRKFEEVTAAIKVIEKSTEDFKKNMTEAILKSSVIPNGRIVIVKGLS